MSVVVKTGDIFQSEAQTLVNPVNCVGVMGKGLALEFKRRFPEMFEDYRWICQLGLMGIGRVGLYTGSDQFILYFPTKHDYREKSELSSIIFGINHLENVYKMWGITSLAVPALGCGEGGLEWDEVGPIIENLLSSLDIPVELYEPYG